MSSRDDRHSNKCSRQVESRRGHDEPIANTLLEATTTEMGGGACVSLLLVLVVATARVSTTVVLVIV